MEMDICRMTRPWVRNSLCPTSLMTVTLSWVQPSFTVQYRKMDSSHILIDIVLAHPADPL